jgi:S1-C subfamily serine protease
MSRCRFLGAALLTLPLTLGVAHTARAQADVGEKVYQQALRSTVWIVVPIGGGRMTVGTGSVIDVKQRLVLTNYHVVRDRTDVRVMFPIFEKGRDKKPELIVERERYKEALPAAGIRGKVLVSEKRCDLAVIQLEHLPPGVQALRLASSSVVPGQRIHSVGNPGVSDALWVYTPGSVRSVYRKQMRATDRRGELGFDIDARIVETSSPVNAGDSGGPVLNDKGELVAVTQGHAAESEARAVSYFIDIREVHDLLAAKKIKLTAAGLVASAEQPEPKPVVPARPTAGGTEGAAAFALSAAKSLLADGKRDRARERLEEIVKQYPDSRAAAEAKQLLEKLGGM